LAILAKKKLDDAKKNDILAKIQDCKALIRPFLIYQSANPDQWYCPGEAEGAAVDSPAPGAGQHIQFNPANLLEKLDARGLGPFALHFALKKEIKRYNSFIGAWQSHFSRQQEKEAASQLNKMQRSMGAMCKTLKGASSGPITRLRCCSEKGEGDIITTDPETIDKQLQAIWGKIHKGNLGPTSKELAGPAFLRAYGDHFVMQASSAWRGSMLKPLLQPFLRLLRMRLAWMESLPLTFSCSAQLLSRSWLTCSRPLRTAPTGQIRRSLDAPLGWTKPKDLKPAWIL